MKKMPKKKATRQSREERKETMQAVNSLLRDEEDKPIAPRRPASRPSVGAYRGPDFHYPLRNESIPLTPVRVFHEKGWKDILKLNKKALAGTSHKSPNEFVDPAKIVLAEIGKSGETEKSKHKTKVNAKVNCKPKSMVPLAKKEEARKKAGKARKKDSWESISKEKLKALFDFSNSKSIPKQAKGPFFKRSVEGAFGLNHVDVYSMRQDELKKFWKRTNNEAKIETKKMFRTWTSKEADFIHQHFMALAYETEGKAGLERYHGLKELFPLFVSLQNPKYGSGLGTQARSGDPESYYTDTVDWCLSRDPRNFGKEVVAGFVKHAPENSRLGTIPASVSVPSVSKPVHRNKKEAVNVMNLIDCPPKASGDGEERILERSEGLFPFCAKPVADSSGNSHVAGRKVSEKIVEGTVVPVDPLDPVPTPEPRPSAPVCDLVEKQQCLLFLGNMAATEEPYDEAVQTLKKAMGSLKMDDIRKETDDVVNQLIGDDNVLKEMRPFFGSFFDGLHQLPDKDTAVAIADKAMVFIVQKTREITEKMDKQVLNFEKTFHQLEELKKRNEERVGAMMKRMDGKETKEDGGGEKEKRGEDRP